MAWVQFERDAVRGFCLVDCKYYLSSGLVILFLRMVVCCHLGSSSVFLHCCSSPHVCVFCIGCNNTGTQIRNPCVPRMRAHKKRQWTRQEKLSISKSSFLSSTQFSKSIILPFNPSNVVMKSKTISPVCLNVRAFIIASFSFSSFNHVASW